MKITDIKLNDENPRHIVNDRMDKLVASIKQFPKMMELRPIIVDEAKVILGGNMRYQALLQLEYKEIPNNWVKVAKGLTDEQKKEFIIKDNASFGAWDYDLLANEWDVELLDSWGVGVWPETDVNPDDFFDKKDDAKEPVPKSIMCPHCNKEITLD